MLEDYRPYMHKSQAIPWQSILKNWLGRPRSVYYSQFTEYLPGRLREYLTIPDLINMRKKRLEWLIGQLANHDMNEINEKFYELLGEQINVEETFESHPYDVNWQKYDQLQVTTQSESVVP